MDSPPRPFSSMELDPAAWLAQGEALFAAGDFAQAVVALERAEALVPEDPAVQRALAPAYRSAGRVPEATAAEYAALALGKRSAIDLYNLGTIFFMAGHYTPATKWYHLALAFDP
ncbi:MAG: tetratricopeptide repeat protein, partial [Alphaproteobacteria bacterium]|nr:tetratricopeptide repeat protein [Alphaproteobacteria bacterium]